MLVSIGFLDVIYILRILMNTEMTLGLICPILPLGLFCISVVR